MENLRTHAYLYCDSTEIVAVDMRALFLEFITNQTYCKSADVHTVLLNPSAASADFVHVLHVFVTFVSMH